MGMGRKTTPGVCLHWLTVLVAVATAEAAKCQYKALFNFGDSNSDTGAIHFVFPNHMLAEHAPYGITYFGRPVNRYSDGRLSIDFLASALGLPFLSPYLQSVGSNYAHGANFAAAGATATDVSYIAPINLPIQVDQFKVFKQQVQATIASTGAQGDLPQMDAFGEGGIYVIDIGGNDFSYAYTQLHLSPSQLMRHSLLNKMADNVAAAVQELYNEGARTIMVKDIGPQGCAPFWLSFFSHPTNDSDGNGCSVSFNAAVQKYNAILRSRVAALRSQVPDATLLFVNTYDILLEFISNPKLYGFTQTTAACCGVGGKHNYDNGVQCGGSGVINGKTVKAEPCGNPGTYVNWDGVHWTDRTNGLITQEILSSKYFDIPFSLSQHCDLRSI